ncbi:MAG TPA: hypothetical protein VLE99_06745 [Candidatus Saccharimonadales bacterium]|nr:hypothetical protein [Candidatus Saccharimonadales bacterium]
MKNRLELWVPRFLGLPRRWRPAARRLAITWGSVLTVIAVLVGGTWALHGLHNGQTGARQHQEAVALASSQMDSLQKSDGLAAGEQCFDATGKPGGGADASVPCSYNPGGKINGCLAALEPYCYLVRISPNQLVAGSTASDLPVTYTVQVSWTGPGGNTQRVTQTYRVVRANPAYDDTNISGATGNSIATGSGGPKGFPDGVVGGTGTVPGGVAILSLADIPGGPSVAVNAVPCGPGTNCYVGAGKYDLTGRFLLATNVPDNLIATCTWDFGDGSPTLTLTVNQAGCGAAAGQVVTHSYADTWQMQNLPDYPAACFSHGGTGVDSHVFEVTITLRSTSGATLTAGSPHRAVLPGCW